MFDIWKVVDLIMAQTFTIKNHKFLTPRSFIVKTMDYLKNFYFKVLTPL